MHVMAYGVAPQVLLSCVYIDHFLLLTLPYDLTANIEWDMAIDLKGFARQHATSANSIKARLLQTTMLSSYQAHHHAQHTSKISILSFSEKEQRHSTKGPQYGRFRNDIIENNCRDMLTSMHKTLFMEHRSICGPAIHCWPISRPPLMHVCIEHHELFAAITYDMKTLLYQFVMYVP